MSEFSETPDAAEFLWKQGDHDGAWVAPEELPPVDRVCGVGGLTVELGHDEAGRELMSMEIKKKR